MRLSILLSIFFLLVYSNTCLSQSIPKLKDNVKKAKHENESTMLESEVGSAYYYAGDFKNALKHYFQAISKGERTKNKREVAVAYHGIGSVYFETEKYDQAEKYLKQALAKFTALNDQKSIGHVLISLGNVYYMEMEDSLSEIYYLKAVKLSHKINDSTILRDGYKNLGALYHEMGSRSDTLKGAEFIKKSLNCLQATDTLHRFLGFLGLAELYTYSGYLNEAKVYLELCAELLPNVNAVHIMDDYYFCLHKFHLEQGNYKQALQDFKLYKTYQDSTLNIENAKVLSELSVKYETEQKEKQIKLLTAENQKAIAQRNTWIILICSIVVIGIIVFYIVASRKRNIAKSREEQKINNAIFESEQKERIRIARDLHDSIGQKLAVMKMLMPPAAENKDLLQISNFLDETAQEVRTISHNLIPEILSFGFLKALEEMTDKINSTEDMLVVLKTNESMRLLALPKQIELSLYRIVQEITSNIVRHAQTDKVVIEVNANSGMVQLNISDHGIGFDPDKIDQSQGLGWKNIFARIKLINGEIKISSNKNTGSNFFINIPIS